MGMRIKDEAKPPFDLAGAQLDAPHAWPLTVVVGQATQQGGQEIILKKSKGPSGGKTWVSAEMTTTTANM